MIRAFVFALDPTPAQEEAFRSHCGAQRFVYNWALARVQANWRQRAAEATYGIAEDDRTPWVNSSHFGLINAWNETKRDVAPWWPENAAKVYESGCKNLAAALTNRKKRGTGFPRFKSKRGRQSCSFSTGARLGNDARHVRFPRIGSVRTHESTRALRRLVDNGMAKTKAATLLYREGRWRASFVVEINQTQPASRPTFQAVGVDLGIKDLAVLSTGERVPNPRGFDAARKELRRAQRVAARRRGPDRSTQTEPSNRWRKAHVRVQKLQWHVAAQRRDGLHKLTTRLVRDFDSIAIEDLHVAGMLKNRRLARSIQQLGLGELRRQLEYKTETAGVQLIVADRWFPSSKTCSGCGAVKTKLLLSERTYICTTCGLTMDRDENAARNLAALAVDTAQLVREQPEGTGVRRQRLAVGAVRLPREESPTQRIHREMDVQ